MNILHNNPKKERRAKTGKGAPVLFLYYTKDPSTHLRYLNGIELQYLQVDLSVSLSHPGAGAEERPSGPH